MVVHNCSYSYIEGWGNRIPQTQELILREYKEPGLQEKDKAGEEKGREERIG